MSAVNKLLDKYRAACSLSSDSALAETLHVKRQAVHQWRKGASWPTEDHVMAMTQRINEPAELWFVAIAAERASPAARRVWLRLTQAAAAVVLAAGLTTPPGHAEGVEFSRITEQSVYYVKLRNDLPRKPDAGLNRHPASLSFVRSSSFDPWHIAATVAVAMRCP